MRSEHNKFDLMRIFYGVYAVVVIAFLWNSAGDTMAKDVALKTTLAFWCVGLLTVSCKTRGSEWVALVAFAPVIGVLVLQTGNRVAFILEHGGMDCSTCSASPLAFLIGWAAEWALLLPGIFLCTWLIRSLRRRSA